MFIIIILCGGDPVKRGGGLGGAISLSRRKPRNECDVMKCNERAGGGLDEV